MRALEAAETLAVWERAGTAPPVRRPTALLAAARAAGALAGVSDDELDALPIGQRDALLLRLYAATFSDRLEGLTHCPECGTAVELTASCATLLAEQARAEPPAPVTAQGYTVRWRLPHSGDLAAIAGAADADDGAGLLLTRCVLEARNGVGPVTAADLPAPVRVKVASAMASADPLAEVLFTLDCPQCTAKWESQLEVGVFVWARLRDRADRLLREVDALARAYGWSETEILTLSTQRRAAYLRLVADG
jgi:hypothetical protein